jgi:hypothetical protein
MTWLFSLLTGLPGLLSGLLAYLQKRQDAAVAQNANAATVDVAVIQAEVARQSAQRDLAISMHSHKVFWVAWGLGVIPVLSYHAAIFFVSTFPSLGWTVLKVPTEELAYADLIVKSVFTLTGASTVAATVANAWAKRV